MISTRSNVKKLGIVCGLLIVALGVIFYVGRNSLSISIIYMGMQDTPWGPRPLLVITNPLPYRVNWITLEPEFELQSGWTTSEPPTLPDGGRARPGNPEPLEPGGSFQILGFPATNVPYRLPVLWEMYPADALRRPKWKRVADDLAERIRIRPLSLPHGIQRSPVIPPTSPNQSLETTVDVGFEGGRADTAAQVVDQQATNPSPISLASGGVSTPRVVFEGPTSLEGWIQGAQTQNRGSEAWSYTNGALVATSMGSIARDVQLPDVVSVDFDLAWSNFLHLAVALYADSPQPLNLASKDIPPFDGFYSLQLNGDTANVFAVSRGMPLNSLGMAMVAGLRDKTAVHVTIRIHKPDRRLFFYIDDTLIKQWEDGQNTLGNGTFLRFVNPGINRLEISNLVVSEWDGQTNAPIRIRPGSH